MKALFVACGGSGTKTLKKLNEMLLNSPQWRGRLKSDIYYFAVDTDESDLDAFRSAIQSQSETVGETQHVETLKLAGKYSRLSDLIKEQMGPTYLAEPDPKDEEGIENKKEGIKRLRDNWWHTYPETPKSVPFNASAITDLPTGAGQCPTASYACAWNMMVEIERSIQNIVSEMTEERDEDPDWKKNMQLYIVTGLSGGTGRGCWNIITFKIRQYFKEKFNVPVKPIGVFFDATVFRRIAARRPEQAYRLKVNAATGLSELSCWMQQAFPRYKDPHETYDFALPSLANPAKKELDVLKTNIKFASNTRDLSPVNSALLIFGDSPNAVLNTNEQYHEMAAVGLYQILSASSLSSEICNTTGFPFHSFGATTFGVDNTKLTAYFENRARAIAAAKIMADDAGDAGEFVAGFANKYPVFYEGVTKLNVVFDKKDGKAEYKYGILANALNAVFKETEEAYESAILNLQDESNSIDNIKECFANAMSAKDTKLFENILSKEFANILLVKPYGINKDSVEYEKYHEEWEALATQPAARMKLITRELHKLTQEVFEGKINENKPSMARAYGFVTQLLKKFKKIESTETGLAKEFKVNDEQETGKLKEYVDATIERLGKRGILGDALNRSRYTPEQVGELKDLLEKAIKCASWPGIREAFLNRIGEFVKVLERFEGAFVSIQSLLEGTRGTFEGQVGKALGTPPGENPYDTVFVSPERIHESLPSDDDRRHFYERNLRPIITKDDVDKLTAEGLEFSKGALSTVLWKMVSALSENDVNGEERDKMLRADRTELMRAIVRNAYLKKDFIEEHFSFVKTMERNRIAWKKHRDDIDGNTAACGRFDKQLRSFIGIMPYQNPGEKEWDLPPLTSEIDNNGKEMPGLIECAAREMIRVFAPWWNVQTFAPGSRQSSVSIFMPTRFKNKTEQEKMEARLANATSNNRITVMGLENAKSIQSPFQLSAYTSDCIAHSGKEHAFDMINNLTYWSEPEVAKWLTKAEMRNGESIFCTDQGNPGIGYVSPIFVKQEALRKIRWKPWVKNEVQIEDAKSKIADFLVWAMFGNQTGPKTADVLKEMAEEFNLPMPLIRFEDSGKNFYITRPARILSDEPEKVKDNKVKDNKAKDNDSCNWLFTEKEKEHRITQNINAVFDYFSGKGSNGFKQKKFLENHEAVAGLITTEMDDFKELIKSTLQRDFIKAVDEFIEWLTYQRNNKDLDKQENWGFLIEAAKRMKATK